MAFDAFLRRSVLGIANLGIIQTWFKRHGLSMGVSRFVAGETLEATIGQVKKLNGEGLLATLDLLGESVYEQQSAEASAAQIIQTLDAIDLHQLKSNVSVKLSQLGLCMDENLCLQLMRRICEKAQQSGNFIRIDMEDSALTQKTIDVFIRLLEEFGNDTVGLVIQSYLYRSLTDVNELGKRGANLRIVKGAYQEPPELAYPHKKDVDLNYLSLVKLHLSNGCYTAIATHDESMIEPLKAFTEAQHIPKEAFEFQMLYGIRPALQRQLVREGYRVRIYTPFGDQWYPYFTRRIAERPANMWFVLKGLIRK